VNGLADPAIPGPIIDGVLMKEGPAAAFAAGHQAKVPYIAGGNSFEASLFPQAAQNPDATLARTGAAEGQGPGGLRRRQGGRGQRPTTESSVIEPDRYLARLHAKAGPEGLGLLLQLPAGGAARQDPRPQPRRRDHLCVRQPAQRADRARRHHHPGRHAGGPGDLDAAIAHWVAFAKSATRAPTGRGSAPPRRRWSSASTA
jgi:hypothetical protein